MSLFNIKTVTTLLSVKKIKPNKSYGQNFLVDKNIVDKIINSINYSNDINIIEIGPGLGVLSKELEAKNVKLTVIEIDKNMVDILLTQLSSKTKLLHQDILKTNLDELIDDKTAIIGNLPYYITSEIIEKVYEISFKINTFVIMVQDDVATKILNVKSGKDLSFVTIIANYAFTIEHVCDVSKNSFYPVPNVDSTVLKFSSRKLPETELLNFKDFVIKLMKQRRKTVLNNLKEMYSQASLRILFEKVRLDPTIRADKLAMFQIVELYNYCKEIV